LVCAQGCPGVRSAAAREINEIPAARQSTDESRVRAAGISHASRRLCLKRSRSGRVASGWLAEPARFIVDRHSAGRMTGCAISHEYYKQNFTPHGDSGGGLFHIRCPGTGLGKPAARPGETEAGRRALSSPAEWPAAL